MASFAMCAACRAEYEDPGEPPLPRPADRLPAPAGRGCSCCDGCGTARLRDRRPARGAPFEALRRGKIGAIKGLGGYHLACDASDAQAVAELRQPKAPRREAVRRHGARPRGGPADRARSRPPRRRCCSSPRRPIVLLRRKPGRRVADGGRAGNPCLGVMLPYTPLHHLLLRDARADRRW